jgi:lysophospholipase L1-like esterase
MTSTPIPFYRRLLYLAIPYVLIVLLLLGIEAGVRFALPRVSPLELMIQPTSLRPNLAAEIDDSIFMGDPLLFWRIRPNIKKKIWNYTMITDTNNIGVRHVGDIGRKKPGAIRVVCLGDSVTFGYRTPLVFPEYPDGFPASHQPYALLMERVLREANPGKEIEVFPMAVPAYTSYQGMNWIRRDIDFLKPDVVTACFGWNDIGLRVQSDLKSMPVDWIHVAARWFLVNSQTVAHFVHWRQATKAKADPAAAALKAAAETPRTIPRVSQSEHVANMLEIARIAKEHNAQPVLMGTIYRDTVENPSEAVPIGQYRDALRKAAEANGILFFETQALAEKNFPGNSGLYGEAVHPNGTGHEALANELLQFFSDHEMLKPLKIPLNTKWH